MFIYRYSSPLGMISMMSDGEYLMRLRFDDGEDFTGKETSLSSISSSRLPLPLPLSLFSSQNLTLSGLELPVFRETARWLRLYFNGEKPDFTPPVRLDVPEFRKLVLRTVSAIPYGHTVTYGEVACRVAASLNVSRVSARAVGQALSHNPVLLIIPCHRVTGADGSLKGYAGGTLRKIKLLELESSGAGFFTGS
ncbi:MAG: methylated-DNA--[Ruminobacter sp.]|nr:methylated-DNA--[protein]-cysteine S-methyltransferase [Ruminobacter sp.]